MAPGDGEAGGQRIQNPCRRPRPAAADADEGGGDVQRWCSPRGSSLTPRNELVAVNDDWSRPTVVPGGSPQISSVVVSGGGAIGAICEIAGGLKLRGAGGGAAGLPLRAAFLIRHIYVTPIFRVTEVHMENKKKKKRKKRKLLNAHHAAYTPPFPIVLHIPVA